jgi:hypothetical protein
LKHQGQRIIIHVCKTAPTATTVTDYISTTPTGLSGGGAGSPRAIATLISFVRHMAFSDSAYGDIVNGSSNCSPTYISVNGQ